jgi:hypothetical protein
MRTSLSSTLLSQQWQMVSVNRSAFGIVHNFQISLKRKQNVIILKELQVLHEQTIPSNPTRYKFLALLSHTTYAADLGLAADQS